MANQHADPAMTVRPPAELKTQAQAALAAHSKGMRGFVVACMTALVADPDGFLGQLERHWPADKRRGRPPHPSGDGA